MSSGNILWEVKTLLCLKIASASATLIPGEDDLSQQNPFAEGYGVLLILLMVIQAIANNKFIEVQKNAERQKYRKSQMRWMR